MFPIDFTMFFVGEKLAVKFTVLANAKHFYDRTMFDVNVRI
jgi:hypothetical protein